MAGIILDPSLLGQEGQTFEGKDAIVRLNGTPIPKCIAAITGAGLTANGSEYGFALGSRLPVFFTKGTIEPSNFTVSVYYHAATILKQVISPVGKFMDAPFNIEVQLENPGSGIQGLPAIISLPTLSLSWEQCVIQSTALPIEVGGGRMVEEWTVRALRFIDPAGVGSA